MWRHFLNAALTAAISGGAGACGSIVLDPDHFGVDHLRHLGIVFAAGAIFGLINWLRSSPWQQQLPPDFSAAQIAARTSKEPTP
jgi:hypothetical protein